MEKTALLAEQYADVSNLSTRGEFNRRFTVTDRHPHDWVRERMAVPEAGRVLDIGCGPGSFWAENADAVPADWRVVAADFSRGMVEDARAAVRQTRVSGEPAIADAERLPFADATFDAVLALQMLYHLPERERALTEFRRVLTPQGRLYASTGSEANTRQLYDLMDRVAGGEVASITGGFTAENGREQLAPHFGDVERHILQNEVRVDDPDALVAYALSLPLEEPPLAAFDPEDADALRELAAARIDAEGAIRWSKDYALFVCRQ